MIFKSRGLTDRGLRRRHNEDQFLVREDLTLYVVADGMGGHAAGEVAADLAVKEVGRIIEATRGFDDDTWPEEWDARRSVNANRLVNAILSAHRRVTGAVEADNGLRGMGATIVAALLDGAREQLTVAHVGDSRAYLFRNGSMQLITSDHSWVHEQVIAGLLSEEAARNHPLKNVVTRALGGAQEPLVDANDQGIQSEDLLLLCSDGLNTMLSDEDISAILTRGGDLTRLAYQLVAEANRRGGVDNITVILVRAMP
ncbi:MAG: protein phosphatase 2C domain-containing protein [Acidobacteriia bacterium]|nr:protein phosphatase 2C domain-containing protein [Terriglobia bacterium]